MSERCLLDTHTIIWALSDPGQLSKAARRAVDSRPLVMSVASYWEVTVKIQKGQLAIRDVANWWTRAGKDLRADVLSIRASHVAELAKLPEHHKDPFDRILISQALAEGLAMITIDDAIRKYPVKAIW